MELWNSYYDTNSKVLYGTHTAGFYSCINCTRFSLYKLISQNIIPDKVSFTHTLLDYKDHRHQDLYDILYKKDQNNVINLSNNFQFEYFCPTLTSHDKIDFKPLLPIERAFFSPSTHVNDKVKELVCKYDINLNNTLAVLHRGTDKWKETKLSSLNVWIDTIESFLDNEKILIQTDDELFKIGLTEYFGDRCFFVEGMIFGSDINSNVKPIFNKIQWAVNFESIMRIISKCKKLVNHSGNCALIPILYRGSTEKEIQIFNNEILIL